MAEPKAQNLTNSEVDAETDSEVEADTISCCKALIEKLYNRSGSGTTVSFLDAYDILAAAVAYVCLVQRAPQSNQYGLTQTFEVHQTLAHPLTIFVFFYLFTDQVHHSPNMTGSVYSKSGSFDIKRDVEYEEVAPVRDEILELYPLIKDKTPEERAAIGKSLVRKLDWKFLPMVTAMLLMNYLDRINVSNARLAGMQEDLHMSDTVWSTGISMFYVGYILSQIPANSCVTICMPAVTAGWGFCLCRFLIGFTEGPFVPAVSLMTSSWYTKHESPMRMGIWHAGNTISQALSGLLAAGILTNMEGVANLRAWKWFLLLEGAVSILVALEPFAHLSAAIHFFLIIAQSYKDFFPSIVATLGFSGTTTYLIQAPPPIIAFIAMMGISWSSGRRLEHGYHIIVPILLTLIGCAVMITTLNVGARYFCMILLVVGPFVGLNIQISWETTVVPRPRTKRAALIAYANCVSSTGGGVIIAGCGLVVVFVLITKWYVAKKNKALKAAEDAAGEPEGWRFAG
ncbi:hypothetical protein FBULB1_9808 [Fusarium bulbicola]|nr:hypothetical protein FBULB1_9808 [Fusarium bulbicola]